MILRSLRRRAISFSVRAVDFSGLVVPEVVDEGICYDFFCFFYIMKIRSEYTRRGKTEIRRRIKRQSTKIWEMRKKTLPFVCLFFFDMVFFHVVLLVRHDKDIILQIAGKCNS